MFAVLDSVLGLKVRSRVGILGESENQPSFYDPLKRLKSSMPYICPKPEKFLFLVVQRLRRNESGALNLVNK